MKLNYLCTNRGNYETQLMSNISSNLLRMLQLLSRKFDFVLPSEVEALETFQLFSVVYELGAEER